MFCVNVVTFCALRFAGKGEEAYKLVNVLEPLGLDFERGHLVDDFVEKDGKFVIVATDNNLKTDSEKR